MQPRRHTRDQRSDGGVHCLCNTSGIPLPLCLLLTHTLFQLYSYNSSRLLFRLYSVLLCSTISGYYLTLTLLMLHCPPLKDRVYRSHGSIRDVTTQERRGKYEKAWDERRMEISLTVVIGDGYSVRRPSDIFNVPKSTLGDRVSRRVIPGSTSGPEKYLTLNEERELVQFLTWVAAIGHGKSRKEVMAIAQRVVDA